jgi:DNA-binding transcriptional LysR family regulator
MIDPLGLHSLIGVRDTGSVTAAAALLGYTPSAVSQQLARLERDSGAAVIERVGRGVVLSPHGRLLAARAEALLADLEALERVSAQDRQPEGPFAVTSFSTAIRALLVPGPASDRRRTGPGGGAAAARAGRGRSCGRARLGTPRAPGPGLTHPRAAAA